MSRVCEEFGCIPPIAVRLLLDDPSDLTTGVMELRAYARAKHSLDTAKNESDVKPSPMVDMVWQVQHEIADEKRRKRESDRG